MSSEKGLPTLSATLRVCRRRTPLSNSKNFSTRMTRNHTRKRGPFKEASTLCDSTYNGNRSCEVVSGATLRWIHSTFLRSKHFNKIILCTSVLIWVCLITRHTCQDGGKGRRSCALPKGKERLPKTPKKKAAIFYLVVLKKWDATGTSTSSCTYSSRHASTTMLYFQTTWAPW